MGFVDSCVQRPKPYIAYLAYRVSGQEGRRREGYSWWLCRWLENLSGRVRRSTAAGYGIHVQRYLIPYLGISVWTPQQLARLLVFARDDSLYGLWWLAALRGPRRGELCALRWTDLDLAEGAGCSDGCSGSARGCGPGPSRTGCRGWWPVWDWGSASLIR